MVIECGHNFCNHCIEEWQKNFIEENPYEESYPCPECRAVFKTVSPNISVKNLINDLTAVILDKEQKKDREETIKERLEKKNNPSIPGAGANFHLRGPLIIDDDITLESLQQIANSYGLTMSDLRALIVEEINERIPNFPGAGAGANIHLRGPLINVDDDITLESLQQIANNYRLTMSDLRALILEEINERLPNLPGAGANDDIGDEVITVYDNAEGELVDITGQIRIASNPNATLAAQYELIPSTHGEVRLDSNAALAAYYGLIPPSHDDITDNDTADGDTSEDDTSEDDTTDNEDTVLVTQESLLETADTIQNIFADHRRFLQLSFSSNTRELAATPAPADLDRPGTGVGAMPGEEQNSENESVIEYDLEIESDSEIEPITAQVNNANTRPALVEDFYFPE